MISTSKDNSLAYRKARPQPQGFIFPSGVDPNAFVTEERQGNRSQKSSPREKSPTRSPSSVVVTTAYIPNQSSFPNSQIKDMIPFPFFPYSYVNFEAKEGPQGSYAPYFVPPALPGMMPNFPPNAAPSSDSSSQQSGSTGSTPNASLPIQIFNPMMRPPFVGGMAAPDPPMFGPGPPIVTGDRLKGPRGCNLFVFHLPNEITNWDLYLLFRRFGTILSVHIMVNKTTGLSKGYGFVSFAFVEDAAAAIDFMDGFRLGKKRLKVQLKRLQDDSQEDDVSYDVESDPNSSSSDSTMPISPTTSRRVLKIFSSTSETVEASGTGGSLAPEKETEGSPIKSVNSYHQKMKPKAHIMPQQYKQQSNPRS